MTINGYLITIDGKTFVRSALPAVLMSDGHGWHGIAASAALRAVDPRDAAEKRLRDALVAMFEKVRPDIARQIAAGQSVNADDLAEAFRATVQPELAQTAGDEMHRLGNEVGVQFDPAIGNAAAADWAKQYTYGLVKDINPTNMKIIGQATDTWLSTPGMTVGQLTDKLAATGYGLVRANLIAITETTRAYTAATSHYQEMLAESGVKMVKRWNTAGDEHTCPLCGPLNRKLETEWPPEAAGGPPRHVQCRCSTSLALPPKPKVEKPAVPLAPPRPQPNGIPVSNALQVPEGDLGSKASRVLRAIDSVHGDGSLPTIPIKASSGKSTMGSYVQDSRGQALRIEVSTKGEQQELSLVHEIGHFCDNAGSRLGVTDRFQGSSSSRWADEWKEWRSAIKNSDTYKELQALDRGRKTIDAVLADGQKVRYTIDKKYTSYLLSNEELFARSYAQYIAVRSGDLTLLSQLAKSMRAGGQITYPQQWQDDEFGPIAAAFDNAFKEIGWLK